VRWTETVGEPRTFRYEKGSVCSMLRARLSLSLSTLVAVVALFGLTGTAQADPFDSTLEAEYGAALAFWGVSAPPQCEEVRKEVVPTDPWSIPGEGGVARATQPPPGVVYSYCTLWVFADKFPPGACLQQETMNHEVGHLLGHGHSEDLANIMYSSLRPWIWCPEEIPPPIHEPTIECRQTERHPHGLCLAARGFPPEKHRHRLKTRSVRRQTSNAPRSD